MLGDALVGWLLPVLVAAIGTVIAQLGDTPLFHVYVGAFIVAAMTSTLWLNFDRWRKRDANGGQAGVQRRAPLADYRRTRRRSKAYGSASCSEIKQTDP